MIRREITIGGGHAGGSLGWIHFGAGGLDKVQLRVIWPDGQAEPWRDVATNGFYTVARGKAPEAWEGK